VLSSGWTVVEECVYTFRESSAPAEGDTRMVRIQIDEQQIEVPPGLTIREAAELVGIEIPALCYADGVPPPTSCLVCVVKLADTGRLIPACASRVEDGMRIQSETAEVHAARRTALELLLSEHLGDCLAPCFFGCPAHMDIPTMLRQIARHELREALITVKKDIALPAILGRVCPAPCEKACRRAGADGAVAICGLKRFVADLDLASPQPYLPPCAPATGKRAAIVGAGPAGLSAAWFLCQAGHEVTLFEKTDRPGGRLWTETIPEQLPRRVLEAETALILQLGLHWRPGVTVGQQIGLDTLLSQFDAVLLAWGVQEPKWLETVGLKASGRGLPVDRTTYQTVRPGLFAAGNALRGKGMLIRSLADGKEAACCIDQFLRIGQVHGVPEHYSVRLGRLEPEELAPGLAHASAASRQDWTEPGLLGIEQLAQAAEQARRCLQCDCPDLAGCKLRRWAAHYKADPNRFRSARPKLPPEIRDGVLVLEPGKCIRCGVCVAAAEAAGAPVGLAYYGRGFDMRIMPPWDRPLLEALGEAASACVAACPTAALRFQSSLQSPSVPTEAHPCPSLPAGPEQPQNSR